MNKEQKVILDVIRAQFEGLGNKIAHAPIFGDLQDAGWLINTYDGDALYFVLTDTNMYFLGAEPSGTATLYNKDSFSIICRSQSLDTISKVLQAAIHCF